MENNLKTLEYSREDLYKGKEILDKLRNDLKLRITLLGQVSCFSYALLNIYNCSITSKNAEGRLKQEILIG